MFGVETFLLPDGSVLLNEVAPRPHNSGHYTIEACPSSQVRRCPCWPCWHLLAPADTGPAFQLCTWGRSRGASWVGPASGLPALPSGPSVPHIRPKLHVSAAPTRPLPPRPPPQFEAHLRAVLGWPLGDTSLRVGASIMLNILGEAGGEEGERRAHELMGRAYAVPGASVHWYGKAGVAAQRKIGHITIVGRDNEECRQRLRAIDPGERGRAGQEAGRQAGRRRAS